MRYRPCPGFTTKHWEQLWRSNIPDLAWLQKSFQNSNCSPGFVAIEAERWEDDDDLVSEIALSLIHPFNPSQFLQPPKTLTQLCGSLRISTHSIQIYGRDRGDKREEFQAEHCQTIPRAELESALVEILNTFRATLATMQGHENGQSVPLILIGFYPLFEFQSMSTSFPLITDHFCSWVDVQELVKDAAQVEDGPSMRDSLIACGFGDDQTTMGSIEKRRSAALHTLRMAALLVSVLLHDAKTPLPLQFTPPPGWTGETEQLSTNISLKPEESHPFTALIILRGSSIASSMITDGKLLRNFAKYNPIAAGCYKREHNKFEGRISFSSLDELRWFAKDVRGTKSIYGGVWAVISAYNPSRAANQSAAQLEGFSNLSLQETSKENRA